MREDERVREGLDARAFSDREVPVLLAWAHENVLATRVTMISGLDRLGRAV